MTLWARTREICRKCGLKGKVVRTRLFRLSDSRAIRVYDYKCECCHRWQKTERVQKVAKEIQ